MTAITTVAVSSTHTTLTTAFCYYFATVLLTLQTGRVHCSAFAGVSASFITPTFSVRSSSADGARTRRGICSSTSNYRVILPLVDSKCESLWWRVWEDRHRTISVTLRLRKDATNHVIYLSSGRVMQSMLDSSMAIT